MVGDKQEREWETNISERGGRGGNGDRRGIMGKKKGDRQQRKGMGAGRGIILKGEGGLRGEQRNHVNSAVRETKKALNLTGGYNKKR